MFIVDQIKVFAYDRTSKHDFYKVSNEAQYTQCREASISRHGVEPLRFSDYGLSGGTDQRAGFQELIKHIKSLNEPAILYVWRYDRLSRDVNVALRFLELCQKHKVEVISLAEPLPSSNSYASDAMKKMFVQLLFINADMQRMIISENKQAGLKYKQSKGLYIGALAPYGYRLKKGKLVVDQEKAAIVRLIFNLYLTNGYGYQKITKYLLKNGFYYNKNKRFESYHIAKILRNQAYIGIVQGGKFGPYKANFDPIVKSEDFHAVQALLNNKKREKVDGAVYVLRKKVSCPFCSRHLSPKMQRHSNKTYRYYYCANPSCRGLFIAKNQIEKEVLELMIKMLLRPAVMDKIVTELNHQLEHRLKEQKKIQVQEQKESQRLLEQLENGQISPNEFAIKTRQEHREPSISKITKDQINQLLQKPPEAVTKLLFDSINEVEVTEDKKIQAIVVSGLGKVNKKGWIS